jgi:hypothetical protein
MKPKNKFQQRVVELSKNLSPITKAQKKWGNQTCIEHFGRRTKAGVISWLRVHEKSPIVCLSNDWWFFI